MKKRTYLSTKQQAENRFAGTEPQTDRHEPTDTDSISPKTGDERTEIENRSVPLSQDSHYDEGDRDHYFKLFDFSPVSHFILDQNGRIKEANGAGCQLLKIEKSSARKRRFASFLSNDYSRRFRAFRKTVENSPRYETLHVVVKDAEGSFISARLEGHQFETGMLHIAVIDITPYVQTENELKRYGEHLEQLVRERTRVLVQNENRYHSLMDKLEDMVYSLDTKGRYSLVNLATCDAFGLSENEVLGKDYRDLGFSEEIVRKWNNFLRLVLTGKTVTGEIQMPLRNGRYHLFEIRLNPLTDETGAITGCTGVNRDVTEIREAREALRQLSIRLLETQEKERRAIGETLHDELGASLTMLNLSLHQLKKCLSPEIDAAVKEIEDIVREVIEQVRSLSHTLRPSVLDQFGILEALQWHFQRFEAKTGFSVAFSHSGIGGRLSSEIETVIYRIVQEALTNAARYSGVNSLDVVICCESDVCTICIEDSGKGFDPLHIDSEGSGITGMQDLASLIGGELIVDSSPGYGTLVTCKIPVSPTSKALHPRSTDLADVA